MRGDMDLFSVFEGDVGHHGQEQLGFHEPGFVDHDEIGGLPATGLKRKRKMVRDGSASRRDGTNPDTSAAGSQHIHCSFLTELEYAVRCVNEDCSFYGSGNNSGEYVCYRHFVAHACGSGFACENLRFALSELYGKRTERGVCPVGCRLTEELDVRYNGCDARREGSSLSSARSKLSRTTDEMSSSAAELELEQRKGVLRDFAGYAAEFYIMVCSESFLEYYSAISNTNRGIGKRSKWREELRERLLRRNLSSRVSSAVSDTVRGYVIETMKLVALVVFEAETNKHIAKYVKHVQKLASKKPQLVDKFVVLLLCVYKYLPEGKRPAFDEKLMVNIFFDRFWDKKQSVYTEMDKNMLLLVRSKHNKRDIVYDTLFDLHDTINKL